jgi:hypothetical protein
MVFEHVLQIFSGKCCLLPLKEVFMVKRKGGSNRNRNRKETPRGGYAVPLGTRIECLNYELECSKEHGLVLNIPI